MSPFFRYLSLSLALAGISACKIEPLQKLEALPEPPPPLPEPEYQLADAVPIRSISGELVDYLKKTHEKLQADSWGKDLGTKSQNRRRFLVEQFQDADLLPEGDGQEWQQIIPLRYLKTQSWSLNFTASTPQKSKAHMVDPLLVSDDSSNWALRAYRDYDNSPETRELIELSFPHAQALSRIPTTLRGRVVVLDLRAWKTKQLTELLSPDSQALVPLHRSGAIAAVILTSLQPGELAWNAVQSQWRNKLVDLLAPGEALPQRLDWLAIANSTASQNYNVWRDFAKKAKAVESAKGARSRRRRARRLAPADQRLLVQSEIQASSQWAQEQSIIGKVPGQLSPQQAVLIVSHFDDDPVNNSLALQTSPRRSDSMLLQLGMMQMAKRWLERGASLDTSLWFASFGGSSKQYAGLRQFLRQQRIRPENIRAIFEIGSISPQPHALTVSVRSVFSPTWLRETVESGASKRFQLVPYSPVSSFDPLVLLEEQSIPAFSFRNAEDTPQRFGNEFASNSKTWKSLETLAEEILQIAWSAADQPKLQELDDSEENTSSDPQPP